MHFEADNKIDISNLGKTTYKQSPVCNEYFIVPERNDAVQSVICSSPLAYGNVHWFVDEVKKVEYEKRFFYKNTFEYIIMTEEDEEDFKKINNCRFREKKLVLKRLEIIVT